MRTEEPVGALARADLFRNVDEALLAELASQATVRRYGKGQTLFYEGDPTGFLMVLLSGSVRLTRMSSSGQEVGLATLASPATIGEVALIDGGPREASCTALEPITALLLGRETMLDALAKSPELAASLLRLLSHRVRETTEQVSDLVFLDLSGRIGRQLLRLAGDPKEPNAEVKLRVTQSELAAMAGGSRQRVNGVLRNFVARGWIRMVGGSIVLLDPDALRRRTGGW